MKRYLTSGLRPWFAIVTLALLAYWRVVDNGYVWDDRYFLVDYTWIETASDAMRASLEPLFGQRSYVRPLPLFSLYMEAIWSGRNPAVSHAVNLLIHIACSLLVYLIARRASQESLPGAQSWIPLLAAVVFAVTPALTENVVWISSRFDLLATCFSLAALWVAGCATLSDWKRAASVASLFLLAALCKESVAVLPALLGVLALMQGVAGRDGRVVRIADAFTIRQWRLYGAVFVSGVVYLLIRHQALAGASLLQAESSSFTRHVVWMGVSIYKYFKLTVLPFVGNSPHHTFMWNDTMGVADYWPQVAIGFALIALAVSLAIARARAGWWLLAWLVCYVPVLHIVQLTIGGNIVHQRFMYLPTAVLLALAPYVLLRLRISEVASKSAAAITWLLIGISVLICNTIVPVWKSDLTLWRWTASMDPGSVEARENLLWAYLEADLFDEASEQMEFIKANGMQTSANVAVNMGAAHYRRGEFERAQEYYDLAESVMHAMPPDQRARLLSNIAINHAVQGDVHRPARYILDSLKLDPKNVMAVGQLVAYCGESRLDLSRYSLSELGRARERAKGVRTVLMQTQAPLAGAKSFCPSDSELRGAGF